VDRLNDWLHRNDHHEIFADAMVHKEHGVGDFPFPIDLSIDSSDSIVDARGAARVRAVAAFDLRGTRAGPRTDRLAGHSGLSLDQLVLRGSLRDSTPPVWI